jgi:hypothetical protein
LDLIETSKGFREPSYLPVIEFKHIWSLVEKVISLAEREADHTHSKRLIALCPKTPDSALDQVKTLLRMKYVPGNWWGWDALAIGRQRRAKIIKQTDSPFYQKKRERQK